MSKKTTYIHAENNNKILSSNEVRLYVPPEPEKMKVLIWGKELCNMAEWNDFLKCVEEKTEENKQLKQQLSEKDKEIAHLKEKDNYHLRYELAGADETITNLKEQLAEKDKEINSLIVDYEKRISQEQELMSNIEHQLTEKQNTIDEINKEFVQAVHDWKVLCAEKDKEIETMKKDSDKNIDYLVEFASLIENEKDCNRMLKALDRVKSGNKYIIDKANQSKTEFAIQELEKVKSSLFSKAIQITGTGVDCVRLYEINKIIDQQIKELKGETNDRT